MDTAATTTSTTTPSEVVNASIGDNLDGLKHCQKLYKTIQDKRDRLMKQQTKAANNPNCDIQKNDSSVTEVKTMEVTLSELQEKVSKLKGLLEEHIATVDKPTVSSLANQVAKVVENDASLSYIHAVEVIEGASQAIQTAISNDLTDQALSKYGQLLQLLEKLKHSQCVNLVQYLEGTIKHWHNVLKERLSKELSTLMKEMGWPFVDVLSTSAVSKKNPMSKEEIRDSLEKLFRQLLAAQLPISLSSDVNVHPVIANLPDWRPSLLPMDMLMEPLRKRFKFHFFGNKQTNSLDKPEWYFTQLLNWTRKHSEYLNKVIQPILRKAGYTFVNAQIEFVKCIHLIAMEKMLSSLPELLYDEHLYSHFIHETLSFHGDMCQQHDYPSDESSCLHVLTAEEPFKKWMHIERKFSREKMDEMTRSDTAWTCHFNPQLEDDDRTKAPECAESFITLLLSITERYRPLPYTLCQLLFVKMQLEILEDYRIRLVQITREAEPHSKQHHAILNTVHYVITVLKDWTDQLFFMKLQCERKKLADSVIGTLDLDAMLSRHAAYKAPEPLDLSQSDEDIASSTIFDESIESYVYMEKEMITSSALQLVADVKVKLKLYADNTRSMWTGLNHLKHKEDQAILSLSESACEMMIILQTGLVTAKDQLQRHLFSLFLQQVVADLDELVYNMVVTQNHFSEGGAIQFNFDMTRNMFPIIGNYTTKPENLMKRTKESCQILTLKLGDALLLKSSLKEALHDLDAPKGLQDPVALVQEQGLYRLDPEDVELVLSRRVDLVV